MGRSKKSAPVVEAREDDLPTPSEPVAHHLPTPSESLALHLPTPSALPTDAGTPARYEEGGVGVNLSQAIREALEACGVDAKGARIREWLAAHYPAVDTSKPSYTSTLSNQRTKMRGGSTFSRPETVRSTPASSPAPASSSQPTVEDLLRLADRVREAGGVAEVREMVERVSELSREVGGLDRLLKCLDALDRLGGLLG